VQAFFGITPHAVLGDTAYGHGKQRALLASLGIPVVAPVVKTPNPTQCYDISQVTFDRENDRYLCPDGKGTIRKRHIPQCSGWQYFFDAKECSNCPLRTQCTTGKGERRIFQSDYYDFSEAAK